MSRSKHARPPGYPLTPHEESRAAVTAGCDPRTIRAWFNPERRPNMCSTTRGRVAETLRVLGLLPDNTEPPAT
jgi:hypothetical protein